MQRGCELSALLSVPVRDHPCPSRTVLPSAANVGQVSASGLSLSSACDVPPWNIHLLTNFLQIFTQMNPFLCLPYIKSYPYSPSPLFLSLFFTLVLVSPDPLHILLIFLV